jgi:hypothetical protein
MYINTVLRNGLENHIIIDVECACTHIKVKSELFHYQEYSNKSLKYQIQIV